jgi:hypothetical protein
LARRMPGHEQGSSPIAGRAREASVVATHRSTVVVVTCSVLLLAGLLGAGGCRQRAVTQPPPPPPPPPVVVHAAPSSAEIERSREEPMAPDREVRSDSTLVPRKAHLRYSGELPERPYARWRRAPTKLIKLPWIGKPEGGSTIPM